jgi:hypothetical protein
MRTTVTLDDDVARALERMRQEEGLATSTALNLLVRRGLAAGSEQKPPFVQRVSSLGRPRMPVDNIGDVLEILEGDAHG